MYTPEDDIVNVETYLVGDVRKFQELTLYYLYFIINNIHKQKSKLRGR
jgi:hypothetical protein